MKSISPVHFIDKLVKKNTVEEDLRELNEQNDVVEIFADPYQMHRSITTLQAAGVPIKEYAQTQANCTLMGQTLFDLLTGLGLEVYPSDELRQQRYRPWPLRIPGAGELPKRRRQRKSTPLSRWRWPVSLRWRTVARSAAEAPGALTGPCTFQEKKLSLCRARRFISAKPLSRCR